MSSQSRLRSWVAGESLRKKTSKNSQTNQIDKFITIVRKLRKKRIKCEEIMEKMKRISLLATLGHLATSQTAPYDIQRKFTASKRRMNTLDPRAPEAKRLILKY